ncbi:MAG: SDR family oxidoreductase, partial [Acidimicrobiales bacterium]|nr:SDR family oxidoreductase [Acidimicrobiales bacterium]
ANVGEHTAGYLADRGIPREAHLDEIAQAIVWLASPRSGFVTGADVPVDGGATAGAFLAPFNEI